MCSCDIYKYKRRSVVLDFRKDIAMELDTNNHSVFMLNYHLIMCVKYRNNVIDDAISLRLKEIFKNICLNKKRISRNQETFMEGYVLVTKLLFDIYRWGDRRYY